MTAARRARRPSAARGHPRVRSVGHVARMTHHAGLPNPARNRLCQSAARRLVVRRTSQVPWALAPASSASGVSTSRPIARSEQSTVGNARARRGSRARPCPRGATRSRRASDRDRSAPGAPAAPSYDARARTPRSAPRRRAPAARRRRRRRGGRRASPATADDLGRRVRGGARPARNEAPIPSSQSSAIARPITAGSVGPARLDQQPPRLVGGAPTTTVTLGAPAVEQPADARGRRRGRRRPSRSSALGMPMRRPAPAASTSPTTRAIGDATLRSRLHVAQGAQHIAGPDRGQVGLGVPAAARSSVDSAGRRDVLHPVGEVGPRRRSRHRGRCGRDPATSRMWSTWSATSSTVGAAGASAAARASPGRRRRTRAGRRRARSTTSRRRRTSRASGWQTKAGRKSTMQTPPLSGSRRQHVVGHVALMVAHRPGTAVAEDHGRGGHGRARRA